MNMGDVSAVFGILLALGIVFPGMLCAWWLLFPSLVERGRLRIARTPWRCFWLGGVLTALLSIPVVILFAVGAGPAQFCAWALIFLALAFATLGASGLAAQMAERLGQRSPGLSPAGAFVRSAIALELAAVFPVIGWFIATPLLIVTALGATLFAVLGWVPRPVVAPAPAAPAAPAAGVSQTQP